MPSALMLFISFLAACRSRSREISSSSDCSGFTSSGKLLSLSFWRDEEAVREWRRIEAHRGAQSEGRAGVFADYRLRVASVLRDYGMTEREQAPPDSRERHRG